MNLRACDPALDGGKVWAVCEEQNLGGLGELGMGLNAGNRLLVIEVHEEIVSEDWQSHSSRD